MNEEIVLNNFSFSLNAISKVAIFWGGYNNNNNNNCLENDLRKRFIYI